MDLNPHILSSLLGGPLPGQQSPSFATGTGAQETAFWGFRVPPTGMEPNESLTKIEQQLLTKAIRQLWL